MNIKKIILHVILPILAAVIINIVIYTQGWNSNNSNNSKASKYLPPGYAIAIVWIFILGLLGFTNYLVWPSTASIVIIIAIIYCLAYPFLTAGLQENKGDIYNILALIIAIIVSMTVFMQKKKAVLYTIPFFIWTTYVSIVTLLKYQE
jgi:tryptophan-rich sensory protein